MDDNIPFDDMLLDLRSQFNKRIPGGLSQPADDRLSRTLNHYVKEVERVGKGSNQDILRLTYDSMAKWFKKTFVPASVPAETKEQFSSEMDSTEVFAQIKAARNSVTQGPATSVLGMQGPAAAPFRMPDLQEVVRMPPVPGPYGVQQKDVLQPHEDTVKYREVEYNLVMNSKDRDWLNNMTQNRYNFVIQFNTNYRPQGYGLQAHINTRLRNITRIEFIKAILPVEGLSVILPQDCSANPITTTPQNAFYSVLALPSVSVLVDEFQGNNFGTNNDIDKSLAVCQYDATWRSDTLWNKTGINRGYTLFFPKFMKAQRVYSPTPLSNLQTLSFQLHDPEGNLLSKSPDASLLNTIVFGRDVDDGACYYDNTGKYIFLQTKEYFPLWSYSQMDKILIQGLSFQYPTDPAASTALIDWLQGSGGHSVIGTAYGSVAGSLTDGFNSVGYANWIIIQNRQSDPATGATGLEYFTGSSGGDAALGTFLKTFPQSGGVLNLSRQVQLSIRIITREYDLVSSVRADNV